MRKLISPVANLAAVADFEDVDEQVFFIAVVSDSVGALANMVKRFA